MKLLHTADLHIGKRLNDISLIEDQEHILGQIADIAESEGVSGVLVSGDVYDRSTPAAEAMTLFDSFLTRLKDLGIEVFLVSGNHDSDDRIEYFSGFLKNAGINVYGRFDGKLRRFDIDDGDERVSLHLLPFLKPHTVRPFTKEKVESYEDAVRIALSFAECEEDRVNILLSHQFVTGASVSDSEEHAVGGLDNVSAELFRDFDYVALGHIHKPQSVTRPTLRYSGSPLKYSLSEMDHKKSVTLIEIKGKELVLTEKPLTPLRDVREIKGYLNDILNMDYSEDFVKITLQDALVMPDARVTASMVFPNIIRFVSSLTVDGDSTEDTVSAEELSPEELFVGFYRSYSGGDEPGSEMIEVIRKLLDGEVG